MQCSVNRRALVCLVLAITLSPALADQWLSGWGLTGWRNGDTTNYGGPWEGRADLRNPDVPTYGLLEGSCGYGVLPRSTYPFWRAGALPTSGLFFKAGPVQGCGQCFELTCDQSRTVAKGACKGGSVKVLVTDQCPECGSEHMDLHYHTLKKIVDYTKTGTVAMRYRRVTCEPPTGLIVSVDANRGSNGWLRLMIQNVGFRGSVRQVYVRGAGDRTWRPMSNTWGAAWETGTAPRFPLSFAFVDDMGQFVTANNVITSASTGKFRTSKQFTADRWKRQQANKKSRRGLLSNGTDTVFDLDTIYSEINLLPATNDTDLEEYTPLLEGESPYPMIPGLTNDQVKEWRKSTLALRPKTVTNTSSGALARNVKVVFHDDDTPGNLITAKSQAEVIKQTVTATASKLSKSTPSTSNKPATTPTTATTVKPTNSKTVTVVAAKGGKQISSSKVSTKGIDFGRRRLLLADGAESLRG